MAQHGSATRAMRCARDLLVRGGLDATCISRTSLLCTGVACMRRIHSEVESEENSSLMKTTVVLIFSLLVMRSDSSGDVEEERYEEVTDDMKHKRQKPNRILRDDEKTLETWSRMTLADTAFPPESDAHSSAWSALPFLLQARTTPK